MADKRLTAFLHAVHSGDPDQLRAVLAEDVVVNSPILDDPIVGSGPAAVVALQNRLAPTLGAPALALVPQDGGR